MNHIFFITLRVEHETISFGCLLYTEITETVLFRELSYSLNWRRRGHLIGSTLIAFVAAAYLSARYVSSSVIFTVVYTLSSGTTVTCGLVFHFVIACSYQYNHYAMHCSVVRRSEKNKTTLFLKIMIYFLYIGCLSHRRLQLLEFFSWFWPWPTIILNASTKSCRTTVLQNHAVKQL